MHEVDDLQHPEDDRKSKTQQRIEGPVYQADKELCKKRLRRDHVCELSSNGEAWRSHAEISAKVISPCHELSAGESISYAPVLDHIEAIRQFRCESEILLHKQNREAL